MQDPGQGVAQVLQNHVHLISGHRFPLLPSLNLDQAFLYLRDAPTIVKQTAPMSWSYVQAPQDGTVWLEWLPPRNGEYRFPSDGYVWGDPESTYRQEIGGYTIELMVHTIGFRPQYEHTASHARTRYHFVGKNPNVAAAPPDPSLWIVHYHQIEQQRMLPSAQIPISQPIREIMGQRRWLESQGRLERKDFMLHDREHWPTINLPSHTQLPPQLMAQYGMQPPPMQQQPLPQRYPYPYPQPQGPPPPKRARHSGPVVPGPADSAVDITINEEEDTSMGDYFDHLSPREISMARYMQHHRWMEEVFSSPYATSQIVPADLGLGLMGELKGLTDGILAPPKLDTGEGRKAEEAQPFTNLKKEQVEEFNQRVEKHIEAGRAEIERMKKDHAEKMAEWKKTKMLMQAEKRLRSATWEGHEAAMPAFRLHVPSANGRAVTDGDSKHETVEGVVKEVEDLLGIRISSHKAAAMIEKGGLEREERPLEDDSSREEAQQGAQSSGVNGGLDQAPSQPPAESTVQASLEQHKPVVPASGVQQSFDNQKMSSAVASLPPASNNVDQDNALDNAADIDIGDTLMDDMDMDMDASGVDFIEDDLNDDPVGEDNLDAPVPAPQPATDVQDAVEPGAQPVPQAVQPEPTVADVAESAATDTAIGSGIEEQQSQPLAAPTQPEAQVPTVEAAPELTAPAPAPAQASATDSDQAPVATSTPSETIVNFAAEPGVNTGDDSVNPFDDGTFDDLTNMDGVDGDDALLDFGGGIGLEDSAFGDAMHGMDASPQVPPSAEPSAVLEAQGEDASRVQEGVGGEEGAYESS